MKVYHLLESHSTLYQVKIGNGDWQDDVDLDITYDKLVHDIRDRHIEPDEVLSNARPTLAAMILKHHGGPNHERDYFDWEFQDFDVKSHIHDVIKLHYEGSFRRHARKNGEYQDDYKFAGEVSIMPQN